ncbi:excinuclease UvrABC ATPase subunit [Rhodococcus sp. LBL1]|nr:excinuclease UvrABC ATPase subunit [Rhodococcus sp. LBL1]MDH6685291.1 excinuclease UvrABC ATPase subunit [Rhodococcus sp. LBL2]
MWTAGVQAVTAVRRCRGIGIAVEGRERLVNKGGTIVIERNLDVIKTSDWIVETGPEGGSGGGTVVIEGAPEDVAAVPESYTGRFLRGGGSSRPPQ